MERTRYRDGIEVDQSDLNNTEDTKVSNILFTRKDLQHFGVVEGLEVSTTDGVTLQVNVGRAYAKNGELIEVTTPITNITGAPTQVDVQAIVGLRITEVTTTPKAHESDPRTEKTRYEPKVVAELFVATDASTTAATAAKAQASSAALTDENFVPLALLTGLGTTVGISSATVLARTKGGEFPSISTAKSSQLTALQAIYNDTQNDENPIQSAEDHFHRGLIGQGTPNSRNPHGVSLADIGFDTGDIIREARVGLTNGILGNEPADDDFTPNTGSFAWSANDAQTQVTVNNLATGETCLINDTVFNSADFDGINRNVSFAGAGAGFYYIVIQYGPQVALNIQRILKTTFDAYCPSNNGTPVWVNNAVDPTYSERQFLVLGLVYWNGTSFANLNVGASEIKIPSNGDLVYNTSFTGQFKLEAKPRLDLRRFGTISNESTQKYTIRLDRLTEVVVTEDNFTTVHDSKATVASRLPASSSTAIKHVRDADVKDLWGHRGKNNATSTEHAIATSSADGFMSKEDYQRLHALPSNVTSTSILRWANTLQVGSDERSIADGVKGPKLNVSSKEWVAYSFNRVGNLTNWMLYIGKGPAGNRFGSVKVYVLPVGGEPTTPSATFTIPKKGAADTRWRNTTFTNWVGTSIPISAPGLVVVTTSYEVNDTYTGQPENWQITCEYQFTITL